MAEKLERGEGDNLGRIDNDVRQAGRYLLLWGVVGTALLVLVAFWLRGCGPLAEANTAACGKPERITLALVPPVVLFGAAVGAFVRTFRLWKVERTWWGWQGAGWFLLTLMVLVVTTGLPALAGAGLR